MPSVCSSGLTMPLLLHVWCRETTGTITVDEGGDGAAEETLVDTGESWSSVEEGLGDEGASDAGADVPARAPDNERVGDAIGDGPAGDATDDSPLA